MYRSMLYHFPGIGRSLMTLTTLVGHWTSFKRVPFESFGAVSYSPSIVTMAISLTVYNIFSIKEWHDLENCVIGCSRSLNMAPFDRPIIRLMTFYWSAIVNIALSCNVFCVIWRWIILWAWKFSWRSLKVMLCLTPKRRLICLKFLLSPGMGITQVR